MLNGKKFFIFCLAFRALRWCLNRVKLKQPKQFCIVTTKIYIFMNVVVVKYARSIRIYTCKRNKYLPNTFFFGKVNPTPPHILVMLFSWVPDLVAVILQLTKW